MRSVRSGPRVAALCALALVIACTGDSTAQNAGPPTAAPPVAAPQTATRQDLARALPDFAPLVEQVGPAVVNVEVTQRAQSAVDPGAPGVSPDDPLYEFFRRFGIPNPRGNGGGGGGAPPLRGAGSGFIVSPDGYILTNAHVVDEADEVTVRLTDRREFTAKVIGSDPRTDVAVIKIEGRNLPYVRFGDPRQLKPGEWVLAIGSPFGFENSATAGIVSATSRSLPNEGSNYVPFIQTDVAVNPGNSGGPLFNLDGEVVGINSQIFSRTGGYMGLSFAIPIDIADDVRNQLVKTGRVSRGRIGVQIQEVNARHAESFGLDRPRGALIARVEEGSPGEKAGLREGDVIVGVNGQAIERSGDLPTAIFRHKPGSEAKLRVWRDRKERDVTVRIGELDEPRATRTANRAGRSGSQGMEAPQLGLSVRPLQPEEKAQIETKGNIVVEQVSGPAADAGLQPGDIVLGVNGRPIKTVEELRDAATKSGKAVSLLIQRDDNQLFVPLRLG
ncbi:MAG TPA: DegQ family serine endoprotease [Steroidobacteraceae bacterium]|nr:DegQ family serine endoprotease [Steroidobacteraceae bacterium]